MKFAIPEISWHNRDPVLSIDFQPKTEASEPLRLATGGTDSHVLIWYISTTTSGSVNVEVAADLTRHQKAVNVVRWSPNGKFLASGDDESIIFVWKQKTEEPAVAQVEQGEEQYKETWVIHKTLRGHMEDVLDISWSPDSLKLASGSVDNKLLIWDVGRGKHSAILSNHKGFVQGVSWDPRGQLLVSASTDRVFRTFDIATKKVVSQSSKAILPFPKDHCLHGVRVRLYHDDTLQTYYRRLQFSPDGLLIAVPAGRIEPEQGKLDTKPINAVYIYSRYSLKVPLAVLPCGEAALCCAWCPHRHRARQSSAPGGAALPLPARLILAVATKRSVLLYDTHQKTPVAIISNIHYTRLTDLAWAPDGLTLVASSTDGFCSVIMFSEGELGEVLPDTVPIETPTESMEIQTEEQPEPQKEETKQTKNKIDSYMKFKSPSEKSPKKQKTEAIQKTPVKLDVLVETAMPSWSDNSNNEIFKPSESSAKPVEIFEIEDSSEDIKLIYEDTENMTQSPKEADKTKSSEDVCKMDSPMETDKPKCTESVTMVNKTQSPMEMEKAKPPEESTKKSPKQVKTPTNKPSASSVLKQETVPAPRAPRRVNFVTLSSPKNKKKC